METKIKGLSSQQVQEQINNGLLNTIISTSSKSYKDIFVHNIFTFFNLINLLLFCLVFFVGSYENSLFIFIIIINTSASVFQEIRAKITLDRLAILTKSKVAVYRNGKQSFISSEEIVLGDFILLSPGNQVPSDCIIEQGQVEVDESMLTGEFDAVFKEITASLFAGSFITSGQAICRVCAVGDQNYMQKITNEIKVHKRTSSKLQQNLDTLLRYVSILIVPIGTLLFCRQYFLLASSFQRSILTTVAATLGMIPEGLVLLTSLALTISIIKLAKQKTLVQELFCIETVARVDTLCLDKTGTLTQGSLFLEEVIPLQDANIEEIVSNMVHHLTDQNETSKALEKEFQLPATYQHHYTIPFSSSRKYSGISFKDQGTYYLGAYECLIKDTNEILDKKILTYSNQGYRVLVAAHCDQLVTDYTCPSNLQPIAILLLGDVLRKDAKETLKFFKKQEVRCIFISGDNPATVGSIASKAGMKDVRVKNALDLHSQQEIEEAMSHYNVFGRVSPQQKKDMIVALQNQGHTVAMTGDGVNDVLALKQADCSIAMMSGSDAAKKTANIVLLNNNFSALPHVVNEGRRVINNITTSASMFLVKTFFSIILAISTVVIGSNYPFYPIHLTVMSCFCVGIPTFLLTNENNFSRIKDDFLKTVFLQSFPSSLLIALISTIIMNVGPYFQINGAVLVTYCVCFSSTTYLYTLYKIYGIKTYFRKVVLISMFLSLTATLLIGSKILSLQLTSFTQVFILLILLSSIPFLHKYSSIITSKFYHSQVKKHV